MCNAPVWCKVHLNTRILMAGSAVTQARVATVAHNSTSICCSAAVGQSSAGYAEPESARRVLQLQHKPEQILSGITTPAV
jgi:hypothetical protein